MPSIKFVHSKIEAQSIIENQLKLNNIQILKKETINNQLGIKYTCSTNLVFILYLNKNESSTSIFIEKGKATFLEQNISIIQDVNKTFTTKTNHITFDLPKSTLTKIKKDIEFKYSIINEYNIEDYSTNIIALRINLDKLAISFYKNKVLLQGKTSSLYNDVLAIINKYNPHEDNIDSYNSEQTKEYENNINIANELINKQENELLEMLNSNKIHVTREVKEIPIFNSHIGTDESGKGDYFGPLVIAGVYITIKDEQKLEDIGVKDSKKNSDQQNNHLARKIYKILGNDKIEIVIINPKKYNEIYTNMGKNLNKVLSWGHARVIENLLDRNDCNDVIADQFGDEKEIEQALFKKGKQINLFQTPKAERDIAVAAASIIARSKFLHYMEQLGNSINKKIPKGANIETELLAKKLVDEKGIDILNDYVKLHFKNTERVIGNKNE